MKFEQSYTNKFYHIFININSFSHYNLYFIQTKMNIAVFVYIWAIFGYLMPPFISITGMSALPYLFINKTHGP
jgi:hypothetical protein